MCATQIMSGRPNPKVRTFEDAAYEKEEERKGLCENLQEGSSHQELSTLVRMYFSLKTGRNACCLSRQLVGCIVLWQLELTGASLF